MTGAFGLSRRIADSMGVNSSVDASAHDLNDDGHIDMGMSTPRDKDNDNVKDFSTNIGNGRSTATAAAGPDRRTWNQRTASVMDILETHFESKVSHFSLCILCDSMFFCLFICRAWFHSTRFRPVLADDWLLVALWR